jgi:Short C-terminal domain
MADSGADIYVQLGKRGTRFGVTIFGLFLLRVVVDSLPMFKSAPPLGNTFLTPVLLANMIVDTLIIAVVFGFGMSASGMLRKFYPHKPDLEGAVFLLGILLVAVLAYNLYEMPLACVLVSPQDLAIGPGTDIWSQLGVDTRHVLQQFASGVMRQTPDAASPGAVTQAWQKLAIAKMRQSPDYYGWIFLALAAIPVVGLVRAASRNLDAITEVVFHKATAGVSMPGAAAGPQMAATGAEPSGKRLSIEDMEQLARLKALLDQGAITQADFDSQKSLLLHGRVTPEESPELLRLKQFLDSGILTREEFEVQRQHLLDKL